MAEFTRDPVNAGDHRTYRRAGSPPGSVIEMPIVRIDELAIDAEVDFVLIDTQSSTTVSSAAWKGSSLAAGRR